MQAWETCDVSEYLIGGGEIVICEYCTEKDVCGRRKIKVEKWETQK